MTQGESQRAADTLMLHELGYRQELHRRISGFTNFAVSFTVISILAGTLTSYYIGFANGGPIIMSWGWPFVALMCLVVALAMAELASAMPTAGGLYYWASKLGSPTWGWFTGWFNLAGLTIATAAVGYGLAIFSTALGNLWFPGTVTTTSTTIFIFYAIFLVLGGVINMFGISPVALINNVSAWWHVAGTIIAAAVLTFVPAHHQSVAFVFTKTINASGFSGHGFSSLIFWFVIGIGLLQAQYTIGGYDASAHMSEETRDASRKAARGVWTSVAWSGVFGWILLLAVTFAIPDVKGTLAAGAFDVQYIWQRALGDGWAEFLLFVVVMAQFFCANADITASSRVLWALSRDQAVPFHKQVHRVNRWGAPAVAVWVIVIFDIVWMLPTFWNATIGYLVATSISVIALYGAYAMPIALRLRQGKRFRRGAWSLGRHHLWIDTLALTWIGVITILFIMPVTPDGIPFRAGFSWTVANYAPLTMVVFVLLIGGWWVLSARHWFRGPVAQGTVEELAALDDVTGVAVLSPAVTDGPDPADLADRELGLGQE
jgi:amino acid transporter